MNRAITTMRGRWAWPNCSTVLSGIPVMAGPHVVEFSWREYSVTESIVASPWAMVLIKRDLRPSASDAAQSSPQ